MIAPKYSKRWPVYAKQWDEMQRTRMTAAKKAAEKIIVNKKRYVAIERKTGVPWYWLGPTHYRESDFNFRTQFAQGDPLGRVSTHVPRGMGPYFGPDAFERAAIEGLEHDEITEAFDWRLEKLIYYWEKWNGWGYYFHGMPSGYLWAGTNIYKGGLFVSDGHWDGRAEDHRVGCVPILKCLMELDSSIKPARETPAGYASAAAPLERPGLASRVKGWFGG
jgi:lysozyme family protein